MPKRKIHVQTPEQMKKFRDYRNRFPNIFSDVILVYPVDFDNHKIDEVLKARLDTWLRRIPEALKSERNLIGLWDEEEGKNGY